MCPPPWCERGKGGDGRREVARWPTTPLATSPPWGLGARGPRSQENFAGFSWVSSVPAQRRRTGTVSPESDPGERQGGRGEGGAVVPSNAPPLEVQDWGLSSASCLRSS